MIGRRAAKVNKMKLFDKIEAVRFPEESLLFITNRAYIYYIYNPKYKRWWKHKNAGNDHITVENYQDIRREDLMEAMDGVFPVKETDFMRKCHPSELCIRDMLDLFKEDYPNYMADYEIYHTAHRFLLESDICYKSYLRLRELFDNALARQLNNTSVIAQIKKMSIAVIGRDIYRREIGIVDGHDSSSYFWIMPVRVVDDDNTDSIDNVAEMRSVEISIEEDDVAQYLTPFLYPYFDDELEANKKRIKDYWVDDNGAEHASQVVGFEWNLTYNYYTYDSMAKILNDIRDTVDALAEGRETEYTLKLREKRGWATYQLLYARDLSEEQIKEYNDNRPTKDDTEVELIIDFFQRFLYRMEYMMRVGKEKGYDLISFMGP